MYTRDELYESSVKVTMLSPKVLVTKDLRITAEIEAAGHARVGWVSFVDTFLSGFDSDERVRIVGCLERRGVAMGWYGGAWMVVEVLDEELVALGSQNTS